MGIDLLIKIFILFFIKIINLLLHYAMEDRPIKEKINYESTKKKGGILQVSNQMKSQIISMKTFLHLQIKSWQSFLLVAGCFLSPWFPPHYDKFSSRDGKNSEKLENVWYHSVPYQDGCHW